MSIGSHQNDHEIKIGTETKGLKLIRQDGKALYQVIEEVPEYRDPLLYTQDDWSDGHGQYTRYRGNAYFEGQSIDTTQEGKVFLGPKINSVGVSGNTLGANPVCFVWYSAISKLMCATATKVFWYDGTNFVEKEEFSGETITHMAVFEDILYIALDSETRYYYSDDGASYTQTDLTDGFAEKFLVCPNPAGTADVLRKSKLPNEISYTTNGTVDDPSGVQWSSPAYVGDASENITNIFLLSDKIMIGREDNLYYYDMDGGLHPWKKDLVSNRSASNFKYVTEWRGGIYFSLAKGLGEIIVKNYDHMGPLTNGAFSFIDDIGKSGACVGLASEEPYLYVAMDEGTNTHIYKCRDSVGGGKLHWQYDPWVFLSTNVCATMMVCQHTATDRRLWFGYGNYAGYVELFENPLADSNAEFTTSGFCRMSYDYGTDANWDKLWQSAVLEVAGGDTGEAVQVKYRKDTDTGGGTECIAAAATNGVYETNFAAELASNRIQYELHFTSNTAAATPVVSYFQAKGVEKPTTVRTHVCTYAIGDTPSKRASTIRTFLRGGRTSTTLVRFADLRYGESTGGTAGTDFVYVVVVPGSVQEVEIMHEKTRQPELGIQVKFQEVSFS